MHDWVFHLAIAWIAVLIALLLVRTIRAHHVVDRTLALDTLSTVLAVSLALFAVRRGYAGYLDIALVLGLLGFTQTVATAHFASSGRPTP
ncbi:MAG TPA: monovalent cation/H+ antiporter complex subunit F [Kofleriaceae bacterium]|nr:monovalent cation/H+ antiporter complex subunit F [Kofleriaceae bacterium]